MIVPSSVEKMNVAGALFPPWLILKSDVALAIIPVGAPTLPGGLSDGAGITIALPTSLPCELSIGELPAPFAAI